MAMAERVVAVQTAKEPVILKPLTFENMAKHVNDVFQSVSRRAYELFESNGRMKGHDLENWFSAENELLHPVHVRMMESETGLEIKAEVPGFSERELEVSVEPTRVVIAGARESSKQEKKGKVTSTEACSNQIMRVINLPGEIDADRTAAILKNGVLELTLPKVVKAKAVRIPPKAAA
jgi:HSP20 family protein